MKKSSISNWILSLSSQPPRVEDDYVGDVRWSIVSPKYYHTIDSLSTNVKHISERRRIITKRLSSPVWYPSSQRRLLFLLSSCFIKFEIFYSTRSEETFSFEENQFCGFLRSTCFPFTARTHEEKQNLRWILVRRLVRESSRVSTKNWQEKLRKNLLKCGEINVETNVE